MGHPVAKIDAKPLRDLVRLHDIQIPEISKHTGLSISALHQWIREGKMPAHMEYTCVGLLARLRPSHAPKRGTETGREELVIVRLPEGDPSKVYSVLEALGAQYKPVEDVMDKPTKTPSKR